MWEAAAAQTIGNAVTQTSEHGPGIIGYLMRKYRCVSNLSANLNKLLEQQDHLRDKELDVKRKLERSEVEMESTAQCTRWLNDVKEMEDKLQVLRNRNDTTRKCFCGLCPFRSLLKLGETVAEYTEALTDLCRRQHQLAIMEKRKQALLDRVILKPPKIYDVPSLNEHVDTLLKWLKDYDFKRIGIWGLPGVGKTTIMENLNNRVGETELFDIVLFVDVSKAKTERKIQEQLLERLQVDIQKIHQIEHRAERISKELVNRKYLLLLDGVLSDINLEDVGIREDHKHGKVVFATRYRQVCYSADEEIKITRLSTKDGQNLFKKIAGDIADEEEFKLIVKSIVKECGAMPQVIKLIAKKLKKVENPTFWRNELYSLRSTSKEPMQEMEEIYKAFKNVYDQLTRNRQPCLLYWTIFPPDYEVQQDYIIEYWIAEQFIAHAETLGKARDQGHGLLKELEDKSLLEEGSKAGHFRMPIFLRHIAVRIRDQKEKDCKFLVGEGEKKCEGGKLSEEWQSVQRVSLIQQEFCTLPRTPECSKILTLLLQKNPSLKEIPELFFESMCGLRVLDLCDTGITSMPSSISSLINLKLLYLNNCGHILELPTQLKKLKSLEILDLRNTGILILPKEIGELTGLKCLRVSFKQNCSCTNGINGQPPLMIPSNVIASLSSLEELSIDVDFKNEIWNQNVDMVAAEVAILKELASLCFYFPELRCFETFIENCEAWNRYNLEQENYGLTSFRIVVGNHNIDNFLGFDSFGYTTEKHLRFAAGEVIPVAFPKVLQQTNSLELIGHHSAKNLSVLGAANLKGLKACTIEECNEMESIIDDTIVIGGLQKLHLINLPKLVTICVGSNVSMSFKKLTALMLKGCPMLRSIFPEASGIIQLLCNLQELHVENCSGIVEIITVGPIVETRVPKLKNVVLYNLPNLLHICEDSSLEWLSLETMKIQTCPKLRHLPFSAENATSLKVIECTENWWSQLIWPNDSVRDHLELRHSFT